MKENKDNAVSLLLVSEGAELNIGGSEPGGASRYGVSVSALSDLYRSRGKPPAGIDTIKSLTREQAVDFYESVSCMACRFDDMSIGVDYVMLDVTTNLGPAGGARLLQSVLGVWPQTNSISDDVVDLAKHIQPASLIFALTGAWLSVKRQQGGWDKSGHGWTNRMVRVRADALRMQGAQS